ncbi:hypothetical protein CANINC_002272 [Pichia inconspicua]|uniref:Vps41 beta-propeller domain-containing protein n=1 Tax=Pichia inconspicua TaxID=52247 RepID=A0A4T0X1M8_9ASCO|nr:hypothetical protein CANINC_002272 [[Candida] inconspicua]
MSDTESDTEYEESPPLFKYKRINGLPTRLFTSDGVSASCVTSTNVILGTHSGMVVILSSNFEVIRMFKGHTASVLAIDSDGVHFATASMDGTVNVGSIAESDVVKYDMKRPLHAVALYKPYGKTKGFFSGGTAGEVVYSTKGWLGQRQDTVVATGGCVTAIKEHDGLLLWCNDSGITIAQISNKKELIRLPVPIGIGRPELYWPRVKLDKFRILIGWLDTIWSLKIEGGTNDMGTEMGSVLSGAASSLLHMEEKTVEIICREKVNDCLIAGLVEYNENFVVLNYLPRVGTQFFPPELKVFDGVTFEEVSIEEIMLNGYEGLGINDFTLHEDPNKQRWFLISAHDAIIVEPYTLKDKIDWLIRNERYLEAWELSGHVLSEEERMHIGELQMEQWFEAGKKGKCVLFLRDWIPDSHNVMWNKWVPKLGIMECKDVLPHVYIGINHEIYDEILDQLLTNREFEEVIRLANLWDHRVFDVKNLQGRLSEDLNDETRELYIQVCLELDEPELCVPELIILKDINLMGFLDKYHLMQKFKDQLAEIAMLGIEDHSDEKLKSNIQLLIKHIYELPVDTIMELFSKRDFLRYLYLRELRKVDPELITDFEDEVVKLYAKYNSIELNKFLRQHRNYSIDKAIAVCEEYKLLKELVFLLSKIGENKKALRVIIDELKDPKLAIKFVQEINERYLWDYLLDYAMEKSDFSKELLRNVGELVDPLPVIRRIPCGIEIEGLKSIIFEITRDMELEVCIYEEIEKIVIDEFMEVNEKLRELMSKGCIINEGQLNNIKKTYIYYKGKILEEIEAIGEEWDGDVNNKMLHKSFVGYKLRERGERIESR